MNVRLRVLQRMIPRKTRVEGKEVKKRKDGQLKGSSDAATGDEKPPEDSPLQPRAHFQFRTQLHYQSTSSDVPTVKRSPLGQLQISPCIPQQITEMLKILIYMNLMFAASQTIDIEDIILPENETLVNSRYNLTDDYVEDVENATDISLTTVESEKTTILFSNFYTLPPEEDEYEVYDENLKSEEHPCRRDCLDTVNMICHYKFILEEYHTMSKACHKCPLNITDCYSPHCIPADGVGRTILTINRQFPGPTIEACEGDEIVVDVHNDLKDATTSIHWHGVYQSETPYNDGVPSVTQCPIIPKTTFRYQFKPNSGTHFWHSHIGLQRGEGVLGPLIIRKKSEVYAPLYDFDFTEHIIIVQDWTHLNGEGAFAKHIHSNGHNKADNILINGRGKFQNFTNEKGKNIQTPFSSFTVKQNYKYRFRLINSGILNCPVEMKIDNHTLLVISSDGTNMQPLQVDSLISYAGERWDFVLDAKAPVDNYWIRFRGLMDCDERFKSVHSAAILHYEESDPKKPTGALSYDLARGNKKILNPLNVDCSENLCMDSVYTSKFSTMASINRKPDKSFVFAYDFFPLDNPKFHGSPEYAFSEVEKDRRVYTPQINHMSLTLPPFPLLSQYDYLDPSSLCENKLFSNCDSEYCECINIIDLKLGDLVEMTLIDLGETYDANHPFHLHGHSFQVVAVGKVGKNTTIEEVADLDRKGKIKRNLINPVTKDTVNVPDGGFTIIRFIADNPGYWLFHCHLEWHAELGMGLVFKVGEHSDFPPVPRDFPKCGNYFQPTEISNTIELINSDVYTHTNELPRFPRNITDQNFFSKWWMRNNAHKLNSTLFLTIVSIIIAIS